MALTVSANLTTITEGTSGDSTYWTGTDGASTEIYQQGVSSEGWVVSKNATETGIFDYYTKNGSTAADMSATDTHLYLHLRCDIAPFIDYLYVRVSSTSAGTTNYKQWTLVDNTSTIEWYGEWKTFILDINSTHSSSNGTLTYSDVRSIGLVVDNSNSGNIRSIENTYIDVVRFGTGITCYESTSATFDFADIEAISNNTTNKYGIIEKIGGIFFVRGRVVIGDSSGTNYGNLTTNDETLVFLDASVSGEAITSTLYQVNFVGNSTNTTNIQFGTKVGTGDTMTGRNGTVIMGETTSVTVSMSSTSDVNALKLYGSTFRQFSDDINFETALSTDEIAGCTFDTCDQVNSGAADVRNCNFLNSTEATTSGAFLWDSSEVDMKNCLFVNNPRAIEVPTLSADMTINGLSFASNTYDIRYEGASNYNCNVVDSDSPSIENAGAGTLSAVSSPVTTTITVKDINTGSVIQGARVLFLASSNAGDLPFEESVTQITRSVSTATVTHTAHGLVTGDIVDISGANQQEYNGAYTVTYISANSYSYTLTGTPVSPATGTIIATGGYFNETTNASGVVTDTRSISVDQPMTGRVRKSTSSPYYKNSPISGTVDSDNGLSILVQLIPDS
jgi:hypothetical protein